MTALNLRYGQERFEPCGLRWGVYPVEGGYRKERGRHQHVRKQETPLVWIHKAPRLAIRDLLGNEDFMGVIREFSEDTKVRCIKEGVLKKD